MDIYDTNMEYIEWNLDSILIKKSLITNDKLITTYTIYIGNLTGEWGVSVRRPKPPLTYRGSTVLRGGR